MIEAKELWIEIHRKIKEAQEIFSEGDQYYLGYRDGLNWVAELIVNKVKEGNNG